MNKQTPQQNSLFEVPSYYKIIRPIGKGAYGVVVSAKDTRTGEKVAIKKIPNAFAHQTDTKRTLREMKILSRFRHENLIGIKDILKTPNCTDFNDVYWVTELMDTDLHQVIGSAQPLSDDHIQYFLYQILRGLKYIHSASILHRDLKPSNLLLNRNCDLKIADFGLARLAQQEDGGFLTEYVATRWYRAPEIILSWKHYTKAVDVWSVGCIFAELLSRKPLFPGKDFLHQLRLIVDVLGSPTDEDLRDIGNDRARDYVKKLPQRSKIPFSQYFARVDPPVSPLAINLLEQMLVFDPSKRITVEEALAHPYLATLHDPAEEPVANLQFNFDYEQKGLSPEILKHLIYQEMLRFHPEAALEHGYVPPNMPALQAAALEAQRLQAQQAHHRHQQQAAQQAAQQQSEAAAAAAAAAAPGAAPAPAGVASPPMPAAPPATAPAGVASPPLGGALPNPASRLASRSSVAGAGAAAQPRSTVSAGTVPGVHAGALAGAVARHH
ncbi:putative Extracellular signal-regulated kinase 1 [Paratrimastix pyriformis]|uniref:Mitogen-activated protein kinase n=1 Tax=Paratrimastix pyriformis TaxID=342808 RepID=A0ABQ8UNS7_9EUKA|nr:putative Extracellular signal-regulated kinase 1 [Paratrimastix pyriformis]